MTFGEKQAVRDVSFAIMPGTKNAIIGPTAAGKTQLLYVMTGLITPASGALITVSFMAIRASSTSAWADLTLARASSTEFRVASTDCCEM